jgi:hypothetical protein
MENPYHFLLTKEKIQLYTKKPRQARFSITIQKIIYIYLIKVTVPL